LSSATSSTSTGASRGSSATPTAERAWSPTAEDLAYKLRGPVDYLRLGVEALNGGDEPGYLYDAAYPVKAAGLGGCGGEGVKGAETGRPVGLLDRDGVTDLSGGAKFAGLERKLAGGEDQVACAGGGDVGAAGLGDGGELEAELAQAGLRVRGHLAQGLLVLGGVVDQGVTLCEGLACSDLANDNRMVAGADGVHDPAVEVGQGVQEKR
jgi:hypothetical protein